MAPKAKLPKCPRCSNEGTCSLLAEDNDVRNHALGRCFHGNSWKNREAELWKEIDQLGTPADEPGTILEADDLLKTFREKGGIHKGMPITKYMMEKAFFAVYPGTKGNNAADHFRTAQAKNAANAQAKANANASSARAGKARGTQFSQASLTHRHKTGPNTTYNASRGTQQQLRTDGLFKPCASELMPDTSTTSPGDTNLDGTTVRSDTRSKGFAAKSLQNAASVLEQVRPSFAEASGGSTVFTNYFTMTLDPRKNLWLYSISGLDDIKARSKRKAMIKRLIDQDPILRDKQNMFATNHHDLIVSWEQLSQTALPNNSLLTSAAIDRYKIDGQDDGTINLEVLYKREISLSALSEYCNGNTRTIDPDFRTALNMIFAKGSGESSSDLVFDNGQNKVFWKQGWQELDSKRGLIAMRSYTYSVKPAMGAALLNVDVGMSAFYKPMFVHQLLNLLPEDHKLREHHIRGLRIRIMYRRGKTADADIDSAERRTRTVTGLSSVPAANLKFKKDDENGNQIEISVWDHIDQTYPGTTAHGPGQYCVNVGEPGKKDTWFLAEHVYVLPGQQYKRKLTGDQTSTMITIAQRQPLENRGDIMMEGLRAIGIDRSQSPIRLPTALANSGVTVDPRMLEVPSRASPPPRITYAPGNNPTVRPAGSPDVTLVDPSFGSWRSEGRKLLKHRTNTAMVGNVCILKAGDWKRVDFSDQYIKAFKDVMTDMEIPGFASDRVVKEIPSLQCDDQDTIAEQLCKIMSDSYKDKRPIELFVVIFPQQNDRWRSVYADFKIVVDQLLGVKSICISEDRMCNSVKLYQKSRNRLQYMITAAQLGSYFGNIAMKLNVRLGNTNHSINRERLQLLNVNHTADTIILGIDVTHPSTGSADGTPSIAAVVASMDSRYGAYRGAMRYQPGGTEVVQDTRDMVTWLFKRWLEKNRRTPGKILVYRDGVSESQYDQVLLSEETAIVQAYQQAYQTQVRPKLTYVVSTKTHNTRLYSVAPGPDGKYRNCPPGTIVESTITSPWRFDFFLQSHNGAIGTARSTHYTVLANGMKLSPRQLQDLTYALCYTYQRATTAVSYPPPTYYADHLCERGRWYLRSFFNGEVDTAGMTTTEKDAAIRKMWNRSNNPEGNPWHENLNNTMFWL